MENKNLEKLLDHIQKKVSIECWCIAYSLIKEYQKRGLIIKDSLYPSDSINMLQISGSDFNFWMKVEEELTSWLSIKAEVLKNGIVVCLN